MLEVSQYLVSNYITEVVTKLAWYRHKSRHIETHIVRSPDFQQRSKKHTLKKRQPLQQIVLGKLDILV
jgi:hypothetical protein